MSSSLCSGPCFVCDLAAVPKPVIIGERINTFGSRLARRLVEAKDVDGLVRLAHDQISAGAAALDICLALPDGGDEAGFMAGLVDRLSLDCGVPLCLDSSDPAVIERGLEHCPGIPIVNSITLERNSEKLHKLLSLQPYAPALYIALPIDDKGMAVTVERKVSLCAGMAEQASAVYGIPVESLIFDVLTFTLGTGQEEYRQSAVITLEAIKKVKKEVPGCLTSLGISNVSFGLKPQARRIINNCFIHHAVNAGLDCAISNPHELIKYDALPKKERGLAEDLVFAASGSALERLVDFYETSRTYSTATAAKEKAAVLPPERRLKNAILTRSSRSGLDETVKELCAQQSTKEILDTVIMPAMKEVGDSMEKGEVILPHVLMSADIVQYVINMLKTDTDKDVHSKGTVVLATVFGDVHDIGKNLLKIVLSYNGFRVIDLGKNIACEEIVKTAVSRNADIIALSAMLVTTAREMERCVRRLKEKGMEIPVLVGGAAVSRAYADSITRTADSCPYAGGVYYGRDIFEGLSLCETVVSRA